MNDLLYYEPLADILETDATYLGASTQVRFGYLTFAASFHWTLIKLVGNISPTYHLGPPEADSNSHLQLPYLNDSLRLHVNAVGVSPHDWLEHATATFLAEVHSDCLPALLWAKSADVATTLLSNVGHTVVIRVVLNALRLAHRRTVDPAVLEEAISTLCLLSNRRYEGRIPELVVCFGNARRRPDRKGLAVYFGRDFLGSKKSAVLLTGGRMLLHCLSNGRVVEVVDLDSLSPSPISERVLAPLGLIPILNYAFSRAAITAILTRQGEVLIAMGARICFARDATSWRVYPGMRLVEHLSAELLRVCSGKGGRLTKHLARHIATIALTLRDDRLGALIVVSSSESMIGRLIRNRQENVSPVEALYSKLFVGRQLCNLSPQLVRNAATLDGAVVVDWNGIVRGIGCIFETRQVRTEAEGARTRAALFASKNGVAIKISQDGEMSIFSNGRSKATVFSSVW
jgi:DNA integrity scanning protein DisA with diadenylate cyclase activity